MPRTLITSAHWN